ncbi:uncharacterized protein EI97DRAFT_440032 [Westerdykella ornata]|uniref:Uncharacterized protein n=1 Tax=Westerdykella ornata TaxID=318751 RepID=A0A6A6JT32_WESOR|nr:uncharacterized protein EI97DRAFT_440032 [Westerdykella ornata]KAF2279732.1 hypothetical protein EI97DRAFT_440032 [Westerdykella ornata]
MDDRRVFEDVLRCQVLESNTPSPRVLGCAASTGLVTRRDVSSPGNARAADALQRRHELLGAGSSVLNPLSSEASGRGVAGGAARQKGARRRLSEMQRRSTKGAKDGDRKLCCGCVVEGKVEREGSAVGLKYFARPWWTVRAGGAARPTVTSALTRGRRPLYTGPREQCSPRYQGRGQQEVVSNAIHSQEAVWMHCVLHRLP